MRLDGGDSLKVLLTAMMARGNLWNFAAVALIAHALLLGSAPRVELDRSSHDFGEIFCGESRACAFTVRNVGDAPLELIQGKQSSWPASKPVVLLAAYPGAAAPG